MRLTAALLVIILTLPAAAADRQRIATINIAGTSLVTYLSCVVQKKVKSWRDAGRCFAAGAAAGAAFYQAKRLAADGHVTSAWIVTNAASSVVENTSEGAHPLSRFGYTFGPLRLRVATPADRARESLVDIDVSVTEIGFLLRTISDADEIEVRDGMVWWETHEPLTEGGRIFTGSTWGIYPGLTSRARATTRSHEAIHAIQSQQLDSAEPPALTFDRGRRLVRLRHVRFGALNVTDNIYHGSRPYADRWVEIEAWRLADDRKPPR